MDHEKQNLTVPGSLFNWQVELPLYLALHSFVLQTQWKANKKTFNFFVH